jgi:hypothetical protein
LNPVVEGATVETITCRGCRSVNLAGTPRCVNCGAALDVLVSIAPAAALEESTIEARAQRPVEVAPSAPPIPPAVMPSGDVSSPPLPPPGVLSPGVPGPSGPFPAEPSRRPWYAIAVVGLAVVLIVTAIVVARSGGASDGLPEEVAGLPRLDSGMGKQLEEMISSIEVMDMHIDGAVYGADDQPQIMLEVFRDLPPGAENLSARGVFTGASSGLGGSGAVVDESRIVDRTVGSVDVSCAPFDLGGTSASFIGARGGVMCVWNGQTLGVLLDLRLDGGSVGSAIDEVVDMQPDLT